VPAIRLRRIQDHAALQRLQREWRCDCAGGLRKLRLARDYEELKKAGVDVKGKIVIVRYGNSFRGVKAKVAEDHGASVASSTPIRQTTVTCRATFSERTMASGCVGPAWLGAVSV
jgi:hypothetical protein